MEGCLLMRNVAASLVTTVIVLGCMVPTEEAEAAVMHFAEEEVEFTLDYWQTPGRYITRPAGLVSGSGINQVRMSPEGSTWIRAFFALRTEGKVNPAQNPAARSEFERRADQWLEARYAYDWAQAEVEAATRNGRNLGPGHRLPPHPGQMPAEIKEAIGAPPNFAEVVAPSEHRIIFNEGTTLIYEDHVQVRPRYPFYRFREGVMSIGETVRNMPASELQQLFQSVNLSASEQRIFAAVSLLEGGFDSVNTYDTGFVSVGLIQFASLSSGSGSLGQVMLSMKRHAPDEFDAYFRSKGLDVTADGFLVAIDLVNGTEQIGQDAAMTIIRDPRLVSLFQRAGRLSHAFRLAQIRVAYEMYFPADVRVNIVQSGLPISVRVGDIFKSEASLAILMDRLVNTGNLRPLDQVLQQAMRDYRLTNVDQLAQLENTLIAQMVYRKDYRQDATLSRPAADNAALLRRR